MQFLIRGNIVKVNFEFLLFEMKKLIPYVNIQFKPLCITGEDIRGDEVPVKNESNNVINFPTNPRFI